jgi:hypothetical protein
LTKAMAHLSRSMLEEMLENEEDDDVAMQSDDGVDHLREVGEGTAGNDDDMDTTTTDAKGEEATINTPSKTPVANTVQ